LVQIDLENDLLLVYGAVPGPNGGYVIVRPTNRLPAMKGKPVIRGAQAEKDPSDETAPAIESEG
jgi:hypothetical protein